MLVSSAALLCWSFYHGVFQVSSSLLFLSPQQWALSGFRGPEPGFRSDPCLVSSRSPPTPSLLPLSVKVLAPLHWAFCRVEQRWSSRGKDPTLTKLNLVRLLWTLFWAKPCPWLAEPSLARISPTLTSNQVCLINSLTIDPLTLPTGYKSPAVFAVFRVELSSTLKSLSATTVCFCASGTTVE